MYEIGKVDVNQGNTEFFKVTLKDFDPDIVAIHAPHYLTIKNHLEILNENKTPKVVWIHGSEAIFHAFLHGYLDVPWDTKSRLLSVIMDPLKILLLRHLILQSNAVVYVSKWMKTYTERHLFFNHPFSVTIPNPIDTELFVFKRKSMELMHEGLAVRNLAWKYGLDIAVRAYSNLNETHLTILGSGPLQNYLQDLARKWRSNVSFITRLINHDKMPEVYHRFGYFVAPSRVEAQGVAMCEAMACGLPVIATNVGGIPEFVKNDVNGLLIPPEKPLALREAIMRLLSDEVLYNVLSENGAKFVKDKLSSAVIYAKEYSVFKAGVEEFKG